MEGSDPRIVGENRCNRSTSSSHREFHVKWEWNTVNEIHRVQPIARQDSFVLEPPKVVKVVGSSTIHLVSAAAFALAYLFDFVDY